MANELTLKQQRFVRHYISNGGNGTQAALEAYNTTNENVAANIASENLTKPKVKNSIEADLASENLHAKRLAAKLNKALDAERTIQTADGTVLGKSDDWQTILKAVDITAKLLDLYPGRDGGGSFSQHLHKHLHLEGENADILGFIARNKRLPTDSERLELAQPADPDILQVVGEASDNNCDKAK